PISFQHLRILDLRGALPTPAACTIAPVDSHFANDSLSFSLTTCDQTESWPLLSHPTLSQGHVLPFLVPPFLPLLHRRASCGGPPGLHRRLWPLVPSDKVQQLFCLPRKSQRLCLE